MRRRFLTLLLVTIGFGSLSANALSAASRPTQADPSGYAYAGYFLVAETRGGVPWPPSASGPFVVENGTESGGYPLAGAGPAGTGVRFIDRGSFWVGVLLRNGSARRRVTIVGARTPEPVGSLVRQIGARFAPFTPCTGNRLCPFLADARHPPAPAPLTVAPHELAGVKLDYRLVSCTAARASTPASGDSLIVSYRYGTGPVRQQTLPLGGAKLRLHRPAGIECVPRPYSHIGLVGSFTTSPGHGTVPGSDGDTCTSTAAGGLRFRSRLFMDRDQIEWRVEIDLPHLRGLGSYGRAGSKGTPLGTGEITVTGGFGDHGWTTFHDNNGTVTVTQARGALFGGRFEAVLSGHRRFFRAYGAWRCTTRLK